MSKQIYRHDLNPFVGDMDIPLRNKSVRVGTLGKRNSILINQDTGEKSATHVVSFVKSDSKEFVKVYAKHIAMTFELTQAGLRAFNVLVWVVQYRGMNKDTVVLDGLALSDFLCKNSLNTEIFSLPTFKRGLQQLVASKIVAATRRKGEYYINPSFIFNGDRIVFSTVLERE